MKYFLMTSLLLFLITAYSCSEKKAPGIAGTEIEYTANGTVLKGFLAYDASTDGKRPGILVVHEWWGHNEYARNRAKMLAELGYTAVAVDMYGEGKQADHPDDAGRFAQKVMKNFDMAKARFMAGMKVLKEHETVNPDQIAAIGYCFGGGVVLHMARFGVELDGVVSFHGSLSTHTPASPGDVEAAVLVCHGAEDQFVTPEQIEAFKQEMDSAGVDYQFITYPNAKHSFTNPQADTFAQKFDLPLAYNEAADKRSWSDMQEFFRKIFQ